MTSGVLSALGALALGGSGVVVGRWAAPKTPPAASLDGSTYAEEQRRPAWVLGAMFGMLALPFDGVGPYLFLLGTPRLIVAALVFGESRYRQREGLGPIPRPVLDAITRRCSVTVGVFAANFLWLHGSQDPALTSASITVYLAAAWLDIYWYASGRAAGYAKVSPGPTLQTPASQDLWTQL